MGSRRDWGAGYSLVELMVVVVLIGILAGQAAPSLVRYTDRVRLRTTLDRFAVDVYRARALSAREAADLQIRFDPAQRNVCLSGYSLYRVRPAQLLKTVRFQDESPGVCVLSNVATPMAISSRGLLSGAARTIRARKGGQTAVATVSIAGRIYRTD